MNHIELNKYRDMSLESDRPTYRKVYFNAINSIMSIKNNKERLDMYDAFCLYVFYGVASETFTELCRKHKLYDVLDFVNKQKKNVENIEKRYAKNDEKSSKNDKKCSKSVQKVSTFGELNDSVSDSKVEIGSVQNIKNIHKNNKIEKGSILYEMQIQELEKMSADGRCG